MFVKSTRFEQVCQLGLSLIVAPSGDCSQTIFIAARCHTVINLSLCL